MEIEPVAEPTADETDAIYALAKPKGGQDRSFQRDAIRRICAYQGISLVKAPPGCGKTTIFIAVIGKLITKIHATRHAVQGNATPRLAFLTAPYIDHAKQILDRLKGVLSKEFGQCWREVVEFVGDNNLPTLDELKAKVRAGRVRVFVSTDKSASLLLPLAEYADRLGHPLLCVKDEVHYNSEHDSDSTKLLLLANESKGDYAIACTATPNADVMNLPDLQIALDFPLQEAIDRGFCAPYEVILPLITELGDDEQLPIEARKLAKRDRLGACALFCVGGMLRDGKRRCIAYASDKTAAGNLKGFLEEACAFHGVDCEAVVITEDTNNREPLYADFQTGETHTRIFGGRDRLDLGKSKLHFLIGVKILDQCIDIPATDSILFSSPPTTSSQWRISLASRIFGWSSSARLMPSMSEWRQP